MTSERPGLDVDSWSMEQHRRNNPSLDWTRLDIDGWPVDLGEFEEGDKCYNLARDACIVPCQNCRRINWRLPTVTGQEPVVPPGPTDLLYYGPFFDFFTGTYGDVYDPCGRCSLRAQRDKDFSVKYGTTTPTDEQRVHHHVRHQEWDRDDQLYFLFQPNPIPNSPGSVRKGNCPECGASGSLWNRCQPCGSLTRIIFTTRDRSIIINAHVVAYLTGEDFEPPHPLRPEERGDNVIREVRRLTLMWIRSCRRRNNLRSADAKIHALAKMVIGI